MAHDAQRKRIFLLLAGTVVVAAAVFYLQRVRAHSSGFGGQCSRFPLAQAR